MNENLPTNVQLDSNGNGTVSFATDVIATIAGLAATEVEGVASMYGGAGGFADIFTRRGQSSGRSLTRGVRVELNDNQISVHLTIIVDYGSPVPEVARNIQENVKKAIETMSGLSVTEVDVHVQGVSFERENRATAEIEMRQRLLLQKQQDEREREREDMPAADKSADEPAAGAQDEPATGAQDEPAAGAQDEPAAQAGTAPSGQDAPQGEAREDDWADEDEYETALHDLDDLDDLDDLGEAAEEAPPAEDPVADAARALFPEGDAPAEVVGLGSDADQGDAGQSADLSEDQPADEPTDEGAARQEEDAPTEDARDE